MKIVIMLIKRVTSTGTCSTVPYLNKKVLCLNCFLNRYLDMMKKFRIRLLQKGPDPDPSKKDRIRRLKIDGIRHPA